MDDHKKRLRSDSCIATHSPPATGFKLDKVQAATRDSEYWFADGNIILISEGISFRVYKGLLSEHSSVFGSMFDIAQQEPDPADLADGCPVISLDDSPNDLRELFRFIFPLSKNLKFESWKMTIGSISTIIRLDHKYELKGLCDQAMGYLTYYYTTSFDSWVEGRNATRWKPDPMHAIGAINLARLTNTVSILPAAFYICAAIGPDLARGFTHEDGTVEHLSPEDLRICLELKARLTSENVRIAFTLFYPLSSSCPNLHSPYCSDVYRRILNHSAMHNAPHPVASDRALSSWMANIDSYAHSQSAGVTQVILDFEFPQQTRTLCKSCRANIQTRDRDLRKEIWRKLPEFIGLTIDDWDAPVS